MSSYRDWASDRDYDAYVGRRGPNMREGEPRRCPHCHKTVWTKNGGLMACPLCGKTFHAGHLSPAV